MEESETHHFGRFPNIPKPMVPRPEVTSDERLRRIEEKLERIMTQLSDLLAQETALSAEVAQLIAAFKTESDTIASLQAQLADLADTDELTEISNGLAASLANIQAVLPASTPSVASGTSTVTASAGTSTVAAPASGTSTVPAAGAATVLSGS